MTIFSWLHITDLHQGPTQHKLWPQIKSDFFRDLKELYRKCGPWDFILFTGDLSKTGDKKEFAQVNAILDELWAEIKSFGEKDPPHNSWQFRAIMISKD